MRKTPAQRKASERLRKKAAGLVLVQVWIKPVNRPILKSIVEKLNNE